VTASVRYLGCSSLAPPEAVWNTGCLLSRTHTHPSGDGALDVLCAYYAANTVAWFRSSGGSNPVFSEHVVTTIAGGAWSVLATEYGRLGVGVPRCLRCDVCVPVVLSKACCAMWLLVTGCGGDLVVRCGGGVWCGGGGPPLSFQRQQGRYAGSLGRQQRRRHARLVRRSTAVLWVVSRRAHLNCVPCTLVRVAPSPSPSPPPRAPHVCPRFLNSGGPIPAFTRVLLSREVDHAARPADLDGAH
jgi:hypothetical protein